MKELNVPKIGEIIKNIKSNYMKNLTPEAFKQHAIRIFGEILSDMDVDIDEVEVLVEKGIGYERILGARMELPEDKELLEIFSRVLGYEAKKIGVEIRLFKGISIGEGISGGIYRGLFPWLALVGIANDSSIYGSTAGDTMYRWYIPLSVYCWYVEEVGRPMPLYIYLTVDTLTK